MRAEMRVEFGAMSKRPWSQKLLALNLVRVVPVRHLLGSTNRLLRCQQAAVPTASQTFAVPLTMSISV